MEGARARDQRPCDNCRRRKIRCLFASDDAVNCLLCVSRSIECTYVQSAPRKKRALSADDDKTRNAAASSRPKQRPRVLGSEENVVRDYATLTGKSLLKETLGHQNRQSSSIIGATSDFDPAITQPLKWNAKGECPSFGAPQVLRRANRTVHFMMRPDNQEEMDTELANLDAIEAFVAPHGPELVNLYFRIVHPSFPILHKKVFLEKYGRSYRELTPTGLGAVYVLALGWWSYSPALSALPRPDAKELEAKVLRMLFEATRRPKISDLQGGLVLMQSPNACSWTLIGHLVAMAQTLGINVDSSDWQVPDWERGVRKRVAWALFMQDKWGALVYGRGSLIHMDDWDVRALEAADFPETARDDDGEEGSADIEKGKQTFLHMVSLTQIVAEILDRFFTLRALKRPQSLTEVLTKAKPLQLQLKDWHAKLPSALSVGETVPRKLLSVGYLHLAYYTAEITLHRAILRAHVRGVIPPSLSPVTTPDLHAITRRAAAARFTSALEFVKHLKAEHHQSFWYFASSLSLAIIGLFAGILCAATNEQADRDAYLSQLAEYRWVLRINATSAEFMRYAVGMLDGCSQLLEQQFGPDGSVARAAALTSAAARQARGRSDSLRESASTPPEEEDGDDGAEADFGEEEASLMLGSDGVDDVSPSIEDFLSSMRDDDGAHQYYQLELGDLAAFHEAYPGLIDAEE